MHFLPRTNHPHAGPAGNGLPCSIEFCIVLPGWNCVSKNNREIPNCSLFPIFNLHPRGFAVSSTFPETSTYVSSHFQGMVLVSVPEPGLSPDILYRCSCVRSGGETFLRPEGPSAVQPLSHVTSQLALIFLGIYIFFGTCISKG
jgi:hypothetical protein